jgi:hypothetical protein
MASAPQILGPDGQYRTEVIFTTSMEQRFFTGSVGTDAVEVQVSVNGSGFSSDPSLVTFDNGTWISPNPAYEPNGMYLLSGDNTFVVRAILSSGSTTPEAAAGVRLISAADVGVVAAPPTNLSLTQSDNSIIVRAEPSSTLGFQGLNFYASQFAGGGATGYRQVNVELVSAGTLTEETTSFGNIAIDANVAVDANGDPVADPLYFRLRGNQEDGSETNVQTDVDTKFEIPETTRKLRMTTSLDSVRDTVMYSFTHSRSASPTSTPATVFVGDFASYPLDGDLYYVITGVYYDPTRNLEFESSFSDELAGHPLRVTGVMGSFPAPKRSDIVTQFIGAIFKSNPQIKVEAGSVLRDTVIDPFSSESERVRFILDFFHRARTPLLLLQVDDPTSSGTSLPVSQSPYKQALKAAMYLGSDLDVQGVVNSAFDAYASNFGMIRKAGVAAQGEVTLFRKTRPTGSVVVLVGTALTAGSVQFVTTREVMININQLATYYNPVSGRYTITVPIRANSSGAGGNVGVGQITSVQGTTGLTAFNTGATFGGTDSESNLALTTRVMNALASVDSGTARGYLQTAADTPGIVKASVVAAGDPMMQRDIGSDGVHRGGKVDVWVQGANEATVTDPFAFAFDIAQDIQFEIQGDPADLTFVAVDNTLSSESPIVELLDYPSAGYEFRNASTGEVFDLTGYTIPSYNTVKLSTTVTQPAVTYADVVLGSYRRRTGNRFVLPRQPVDGVSSVVGVVSGTLPTTAWTLVYPDAPLDLGRSDLAKTYIDIMGYTDTSGNLVPSGALIPITNEIHVLVGQYPEFLDSLGANFLTLKVYNQSRTIEYRGPNDPGGTPDYTVNLGTETTAVSLTRVEAGAIPSGATVSVDYAHDENFVVTYTTNLLVSTTQANIDADKHATADVVVKEGLPVPMDISATIVLGKGSERTTVDSELRTNLTNFFANLRLGDPVRQSDIIRVMENTTGVSYVVVPLNKMVRQVGATVVREAVSTDTASESTLLSSLTTAVSATYILNNVLSAATTDGGGASGTYKGVFQNDLSLTLLGATASLVSLGLASGRAFIIGGDGAVIMGFSDDTTLIAEGYVQEEARAARRVLITANRLLISLPIGESPTAYSYACTYIVGSDSGAKDTDPSSVAYLTEGSLVFTYDQDQ